MKIKIVCVGKIKEKYLVQGIAEYVKRLSNYAQVEIIEVSETKINDNPRANDIVKVIEDEGQKLTTKIKQDDFIIALDVAGQNLTNHEYVAMLNRAKNSGYSTFTFIIGGSYGLSDQLKSTAHFKWSFSQLVFPHQLMRLILLEQIYRGFKIDYNEPYHK